MATNVLVTGATGGIGAAVAAELTRRGHRVLLTVRDEARLAALRERFPSAEPVVVDLGQPDAVAAATASLDLRSGLAGLVHCAGVVDLGTLDRLTAPTWATALAVNLAGPAELTRVMLPALRRARGHVLFVNSGQGQHASPGWSAYAASKFGLRALADALRAEEAGSGVRVSSVYPGRTDTGMQRRVRAQEGKDYDPSQFLPPEVVARVILNVWDTPPGAAVTETTIRPGV